LELAGLADVKVLMVLITNMGVNSVEIQ